MAAYTTAVDNALIASDAAAAAYAAADTDLTTQIAMDVITAAWKGTAQATYDII